MRKLYESLKEHETRIIRFKNEKVLPLTNKELRFHEEYAIFAENISWKNSLGIYIIEK